MHQNWMRDYDPTTGRYIEADPLGLVDGASVYGYVRQNPGRWVDPRGERLYDVVAATAGADLVTPDRSDAIPLKWAGYGAAALGALAVDKIIELCLPEDPCAAHYASIQSQLNLVKKRYSEYIDDKLNLPETGPYPPGSRTGHRDAIRDAQRGLRNRLNAANAADCRAYPADAWFWATRAI